MHNKVSGVGRLAFLALGLYGLLQTPALAGDVADKGPEENGAGPEFAMTLDLTYNSLYIWRGINTTDGPVFQPSLELSYGGLTASFWGNLETTDVTGNRNDFTEVDYTLDYSWSWKKLNLSVGVIYYQFPEAQTLSTTEVYVGVGLDVLLSPTITVYQDLHRADGTYASLSIGHTFEDVWKPSRNVAVSVEAGASIGYASSRYNRYYYGSAGAAFTDALLSLGLPIQIGEHLTITPAINYSALLAPGIQNAMSDDNNFWGGVSVTYSF